MIELTKEENEDLDAMVENALADWIYLYKNTSEAPLRKDLKGRIERARSILRKLRAEDA